MTEEYNEFGEIVEPVRRLDSSQEHRIHQTKDLFEGDCIYCQKEAKKFQEQHQSWWSDE